MVDPVIAGHPNLSFHTLTIFSVVSHSMQIYPYGFIYRNFLIFVSFNLYELVALTVTRHIVYFYLGQEWVVVLQYFMDNRKLNEVVCNQNENIYCTFLD